MKRNVWCVLFNLMFIYIQSVPLTFICAYRNKHMQYASWVYLTKSYNVWTIYIVLCCDPFILYISSYVWYFHFSRQMLQLAFCTHCRMTALVRAQPASQPTPPYQPHHYTTTIYRAYGASSYFFYSIHRSKLNMRKEGIKMYVLGRGGGGGGAVYK